MLKCAVVGATGYTGTELVKILLRHPGVEIAALSTRQKESIPIRRLIPTLPLAAADLTVQNYTLSEINRLAEAVFLCLPHTEAMEAARTFYEAGRVVIDLSADLRLRSPEVYEKWYGVKHREKGLLKKAVYGLPELYREKIRKADLIANPGCYPTVSILALLPLVRRKLVDLDSIIIDAKSGVSGAGKKLAPGTQFSAVAENFYAYKVGRHQHTPEIEQCLSDAARQGRGSPKAAGSKIHVTFTPHLLPVDRGILATVYVKRKKGVKAQAIRQAFQQDYEAEPFVRVKPEGSFPSLKDVQGTNYCDIGISVDPKGGQVTVIAAIDNLLKGASGQAVQNLNLRFGFPEEEGLRAW